MAVHQAQIRKQQKKLKPLFSKVIRLVGKCQRCGGTKALQCSHIRTTHAHPRLQFDLDNALCLCYTCHIFFWHKEVLESADWFRKTFPEQAERLEEKLKNEANLPPVDYQALIDDYTSRLK